jgi:hypothetical protein
MNWLPEKCIPWNGIKLSKTSFKAQFLVICASTICRRILVQIYFHTVPLLDNNLIKLPNSEASWRHWVLFFSAVFRSTFGEVSIRNFLNLSRFDNRFSWMQDVISEGQLTTWHQRYGNENPRRISRRTPSGSLSVIKIFIWIFSTCKYIRASTDSKKYKWQNFWTMRRIEIYLRKNWESSNEWSGNSQCPQGKRIQPNKVFEEIWYMQHIYKYVFRVIWYMYTYDVISK